MPPWTPRKVKLMKNAILKLRMTAAEKDRLEQFAREAGKPVSEIVRQAVRETIVGHVAGHKRRQDIMRLRRSTNLMIETFAAKPIDISLLKQIAAQVRRDAATVLA